MTLPKLVAEDTMIPYTTWSAEGIITHHSHPVKAGSHVIIDSPACSRNPFAWEDSTTYNPRRWIEKTDSGIDHFTGFSSGVRVCIGKRMAEVEMITVIGIMCKEYKMSPVAKDGESREELVKRMMKGTEDLNLKPPVFGLKLEKRV
jgi:cytochrome P450